MSDDIQTIEWDVSTGKPPKRGEKLRNTFGEKFVVISSKGNIVTLKKVSVPTR